MSKKTRVLVVDDSSVLRLLLTQILNSDPDLEVVGTAPDPYVARERLIELNPDVMTLDIEMPRMDGVTFLGKVMEHFPVRTIVISSLSSRGSELALQALAAGAVDVMQKPSIDVYTGIATARTEIIARVKAAAATRMTPLLENRKGRERTGAPKISSALAQTTHQILAIASSTGGTEALKRVLPLLPRDLPGTLIVQHMPPVFTKTFSSHLQALCDFEVREAQDGDRILPGMALLAPGNFHMTVERSGAYYYVRLNQAPIMHGVRPAADYLFQSIAKYVGRNAVGVVLTGMGRDGADGLLAMKRAGAYTIAQDEETSVVYGMPKAAVELGAVDLSRPLDRIAESIMSSIAKRAATVAA